MKAAKYIITALVVAGIIFVGYKVVNKYGNKNSSTQNEDVLNDDVVNKMKVYPGDATVNVGKFSFKVLSVANLDKIMINNSYRYPYGVYKAVTVQVVNNDSNEHTIQKDMFKIVDSNNDNYNIEDGISNYNYNNKEFFSRALNPKLSKTGVLIFDVPKDSKDLGLVVKSSSYSMNQSKIKIK